MSEFMTIKQASKWASEYLEKDVTASNIAYLNQQNKFLQIGNNKITEQN